VVAAIRFDFPYFESKFMKQPYDWTKPITTQNPNKSTRSSIRNMSTVTKEQYNELVMQFETLRIQNNLFEQNILQQQATTKSLETITKLNTTIDTITDKVNDTTNLDTIKIIQDSLKSLNEKISKPTIKPVLPIPSSQPLFSGKMNENINLWFTITENNFSLSNLLQTQI